MISSLHDKGRIIALDYGKKRIGVAVSDVCWWGATPLPFISNQKGHQNSLIRLKQIIDSYQGSVCLILVGLPLLDDGRETQQTQYTRRFVNFLKDNMDLPIEVFDENSTTKEAIDFQQVVRTRRSKRSQTIDSLSAKVLLERYLVSMS